MIDMGDGGILNHHEMSLSSVHLISLLQEHDPIQIWAFLPLKIDDLPQLTGHIGPTYNS